MTEIGITCPVYPSEDPVKVRTAIERIFPDAITETKEDQLISSSTSIEKFSKQIRKQKILDTARSMMIRGRRGDDRTVFFLNKQVAYMGKISFTEEKTLLGSLRVEIKDEEMEAFINIVAPETVDGEEVRI